MKSLTIVKYYENIVEKGNDYIDYKFKLEELQSDYFLLVVVEICETEDKKKLRFIVDSVDEDLKRIDRYYVEVEANEFDNFLKTGNTLDIKQENWDNLVKFGEDEEPSDAQLQHEEMMKVELKGH